MEFHLIFQHFQIIPVLLAIHHVVETLQSCSLSPSLQSKLFLEYPQATFYRASSDSEIAEIIT